MINWQINAPETVIRKLDETEKRFKRSIDEFERLCPREDSEDSWYREEELDEAKEYFKENLYKIYRELVDINDKYGRLGNVEKKLEEIKIKLIIPFVNSLKKPPVQNQSEREFESEIKAIDLANDFRKPTSLGPSFTSFFNAIESLEQLKNQINLETQKYKWKNTDVKDVLEILERTECFRLACDASVSSIAERIEEINKFIAEFNRIEPKLDASYQVNSHSCRIKEKLDALKEQEHKCKADYGEDERFGNDLRTRVVETTEELYEEINLKSNHPEELLKLGTGVKSDLIEFGKSIEEQIADYKNRFKTGDYEIDEENEIIRKYLKRSTEDFDNLVKSLHKLNYCLEQFKEVTVVTKKFEVCEINFLELKAKCDQLNINCKANFKQLKKFIDELKKTFILPVDTGIQPEWVGSDGVVNFNKNNDSKNRLKEYGKLWRSEDNQRPSCFDILQDEHIIMNTLRGFKRGGNMLVKDSKKTNCGGQYNKFLDDDDLCLFIVNSYDKLKWA